MEYKPPREGSVLSVPECREAAIWYALKGLGRVSPNPLVGAVIVDRNHRFVSGGAHLEIGGPHAEINALHAARGDISGGTMFVTLEPCCFVGRTQPCTDALMNLPLKEIHVGCLDPNPKVDGAGQAQLQRHGIDVKLDEHWLASCERLAEIYLWHIRRRAPFVAAKIATSANGVYARLGDKRQWITGERAREFGHFLRCQYDAILVGCKTLELDDPELSCRHKAFSRPNVFKIVIDTQGTVVKGDGRQRIFSEDPSRVIIVTNASLKDNLEGVNRFASRVGCQVMPVSYPIDLKAWAKSVYDRFSITSILIEGGGETIKTFLDQGMVNRLYQFVAPSIIGGEGLKFLTHDLPKSLTLTESELTVLEKDLLINSAIGN
jgi:diaminohydroxyphosphoribosylaminopyrimidine deaminase / 5-amino-6-(5-phosphoribosylamino)uracil reductase